jgi:hypothetical protein
MNFISSLPTVVTEHGNGRFAARVNRSPPGCGMVRLSRRRSPLRLAKSHSRNFWNFWNSAGKAIPELRRSTSGGNGGFEMTNENFARLIRGLTIAVGNRKNRILFYQFLAAEIRALHYSYGIGDGESYKRALTFLEDCQRLTLRSLVRKSSEHHVEVTIDHARRVFSRALKKLDGSARTSSRSAINTSNAT